MTDLVNNSNHVESETHEMQGLHYFQETLQKTIHHFYITGEIGPASYYIDMIHSIRTANPSDVVHLHLNTTGGHLDTGIQIINAIYETQAYVIASLEAQAFSMGSMLFLVADEFIVHDNAMLMIHNFSSVFAGKGNEQRLRLDAITSFFNQFAEPIYIPFLSDDELADVIEGKDMWLQAPDIKLRLEKMVSIRAKKKLEAEEALEQALLEEMEESVPAKKSRSKKSRSKKTQSKKTQSKK